MHDGPLGERMNDFPSSAIDKRASTLLPTARTRNGKVALPLVDRGHNGNLMENATPSENVRLKNTKSPELIGASKDMS
jgi:hypothetical protein